MAMMKCPKCGRDGISNSATMCFGCGYNLKDHFDQLRKQEQAEKERVQRIRDALQKDVQSTSKGNAKSPSSTASSTVGTAIKMVSIIAFVLCVIGSLIVIGESLAIGLVMVIMSVLFGLLCYGIGEIVCLLQDIKEKIR